MAELGPVELLFVEFPGNQFTGEIIPALRDLLDQGTIRILDLVFGCVYAPDFGQDAGLVAVLPGG